MLLPTAAVMHATLEVTAEGWSLGLGVFNSDSLSKGSSCQMLRRLVNFKSVIATTLISKQVSFAVIFILAALQPAISCCIVADSIK